jgi:hypothetical protein
MVSLSLRAGNYKPSMYGLSDTSELSFAVHSINLRTFDLTNPNGD